MTPTTTSASKTPAVDPYEIPEVASYLAANSVYEAFKARNAKLLEEFIKVSEARNEALEAASAAVRARGISCGPFQLTGTPYFKVDALKVIEAVGKDRFYQLGGVSRDVTEYTIPYEKLVAAAASGAISKDVVDLAAKKVSSYSRIDPVKVP